MVTRCPTCKRVQKRSTEANRRYWLIIHLIADKVKPDGQEFAPETWHQWAKLRWLGGDDVKLPNGKVIVVPKSSAELGKDEFHEFVCNVEEWALDRGVVLDEIQQ